MGFHRIPTVLATLGLTALLASAPAVATDVLLDFSGNICGDATNAACTNGAGIGQGYGDVAGLLDVLSIRGIASGLNGGEKVVASAGAFLKPGDKIKPVLEMLLLLAVQDHEGKARLRLPARDLGALADFESSTSAGGVRLHNVEYFSGQWTKSLANRDVLFDSDFGARYA